MLCSISGQVPVEPVVSVKSGHVFEKRLVLAYLTQNQSRCPVTNDELDAERDLLPLQPSPAATGSAAANGASNLSAFSPEAASIPQILALFQNEWDAVMLETFTLKKHLEKTRQELSHALYQHDAACRVIARLNSENESLRTKLATRAAPSAAESNGDDVDMDASSGSLSAEAIATIEATQRTLAKERKEFKKTEAPARAQLLRGLAKWTAVASHTLHDSDKPGVLSLAIDPKQLDRVATGGVDKNIKVFNTTTQQLAATLAGHGKKVSDVVFHPSADLIVSGSHDKTVKVWSAKNSGYAAVHTLSFHEDAVTSASIHPTGEFVLSSSLDASWAVSDIRSGKLLSRYYLNGEASDPKNANAANEALCAVFHPDGAIFATGSKNKQVQMWDIKTMNSLVTFDGHKSGVTSLSFSENGYHLATGSQDGVVNIWDLRKLKSIFEVNLNQGDTKIGSIHEVNFDPSGTHLAVAGANIQVLKEKNKTNWELFKTFDDHKAAVTSVKFAPDSSYFASTSMDRSLKFYR